MTGKPMPKVSIGLPVYNGENYLEDALLSILGQTYERFELIISDNASTDGTETICRKHAAQDDRVRYFRNERNTGGAPNFNRVFELAHGEYFKWAAHDDVCRPDFLRRCVEALDEQPSVVLSYTRAADIDEEGKEGKQWRRRPELQSPVPRERFRRSLLTEETLPVFGLVRAAVLRRTRLVGSYPASDRVLLAELSLHGPFHEVPEVLFLHREHAERSVRAYDWQRPHEAVAWYDPNQAGKLVFPEWRLWVEYVHAIRRSPLPVRDRCGCAVLMLAWMGEHRSELLRDLRIAVERVPGLGPIVSRAYQRHQRGRRERRLRRAMRDIESVVPEADSVILVDEGMFRVEQFRPRQVIPFLERDGVYWGRPADDDVAIRELNRLHDAGARFLIFSWPTFWWLSYYRGFGRYLREQFPCLLEDERLIVFDLRGPDPDARPRFSKAGPL